MKKAILLFCMVMMITAWYSCTKDTAPVPAVVQTGNCDSTKVNYTKDVVPIINATCLGSSCHSPGGTAPTDFTSFVVVKSDIDNILCRIHYTGTSPCGARMPQGLPMLTDSVKAVFANWKADNFYDCH